MWKHYGDVHINYQVLSIEVFYQIFEQIYFEYLMCALSYIHHVAMSTNVMYVSLHTFSFIFNMYYIFDVCMIVSIFRFVPYFSTKFIFRLFLLCWLCVLDDRNACIYRSNEFINFYWRNYQPFKLLWIDFLIKIFYKINNLYFNG